MKRFLLLLVFTIGVFASTPEQKGYEIAKKIEDFNDGYIGEESVLEMILINAHGDKITRKMNSKTLENDKTGAKSLIEFEWPADVKGTKMLTWSNKEGSDDQWLYLPAFKRVKRISSNNKSGSFMGSEFSYEDLGSQELEKYTYKFIKEEKLNGENHWVVERFAKDKDSGYSKQVSWLNQKYMSATKVEYYDRKGELLKTALFSDFKPYKKYFRPMKIDMKNHQTQKASLLEWKNRELFKKYDDSEFSNNRLK